MRLVKVTLLVFLWALFLSIIVGPSFAPVDASDSHDADAIVNEGGKAAASPSNAPTMTAAEDSAANAPAAKHGGGFWHTLGAPFRAIGRLFGGSKKTAQAGSAGGTQPAANQTTTSPPVVAAQTAPKAKSKAKRQQTAQMQAKQAPQAVGYVERNEAGAKPTRRNSTVATFAPPPSLADAPTSLASPERFTPVIEGVPRDPLSQGRALLERGQIGSAIAALSVAAVTGPDLLAANNLLGLAYDRTGQHERAQEYYMRALTFAPNDANALNNLGHSLYLADHYSEALQRLKQAARLAPNDPQIANNLALVYGRLHKYDDAYKQFVRAGGEFYARMQTGALLEADGRDREAIKQFELARLLDPANSETLRHLINLYVRTGQPGKAEDARQQLNHKPDNKHADALSSISSS